MKRNFVLYLIYLLAVLIACTKKTGTPKPQQSEKNLGSQPIHCAETSSTVISYSSAIFPLISSRCLSGGCHVTPGAGGVNLDSYPNIKAASEAGVILPLVANTDTNSPMMPPPPARHLDSCEIKSISLWIQQGCKLN